MHPNASRIDPSSRLSFVRRLCATLARLARHKRGNVLMIMGFALVPMTFATGMVIDYSRAARLQTKLNAAADAASLSAVTKPMLTQSLEASCNAARRTFLNATQQYSTGMSFTAASDLQISITDSYTSGSPVTLACPMIDATVPGSFTTPVTRVVAITYGARSANAFGGVLGQSNINIGGTATSRAGLDAFYQIIFVVDVSNSMGIGGTADDVAKMYADKTIMNDNNKAGCQFACHDPNGTVPVKASDYCDTHPSDYFCHTGGPTYCPFGAGKCTMVNNSSTYGDRRALAKLYGYKLKIDYVNDAINAFMTSLKPQMDKAPNNYSLSIYTFGSRFTELQKPTTDYATVKAAAATIDVEIATSMPSTTTGDGSGGWTFTSSGLSSTRGKLTNVGNGSSATARKTYVVFLSDGVEDDYGYISYGRGTFYKYATECQAIKNAGVTMFSIEAFYPVIDPDPSTGYVPLVANLPSRNGGTQIADVMKGCASSPDKYFLASDGPAIQNAVSNVFASITAETARLSR